MEGQNEERVIREITRKSAHGCADLRSKTRAGRVFSLLGIAQPFDQVDQPPPELGALDPRKPLDERQSVGRGQHRRYQVRRQPGLGVCMGA
jgi:hypothetical protein